MQRATIIPQSRIAAADLQDPEDLSLPSAVGVETACVASVCATAVILERSGESCVSVMTSTACDTKESYAQAMVYVTVASASVHQTGRETTATAPDALTPVCPTWVSCAVGEVSVFVEFVSAHSREPTGPHVTSAPPAQMPVQ